MKYQIVNLTVEQASAIAGALNDLGRCWNATKREARDGRIFWTVGVWPD